MNPFNTDQVFTPLHDIAAFHEKFGLGQNNSKVVVGEARDNMHPEEWNLRHVRLADEADEYAQAVEEEDDEQALDALVDIVYIALGTAYRRGWDFAEAWRRVHTANMSKMRGEPNNSKYGSGFDIVKPKGWQSPDHTDLVTP